MANINKLGPREPSLPVDVTPHLNSERRDAERDLRDLKQLIEHARDELHQLETTEPKKPPISDAQLISLTDEFEFLVTRDSKTDTPDDDPTLENSPEVLS